MISRSLRTTRSLVGLLGRPASAGPLLVLLAGLFTLSLPAAAAEPAPVSAGGSSGELEALVDRAYRYALPVYEIARLRYRQSLDPANSRRAPLNTLTHSRALADHNSRWVTTPNNDTLYSSANLDLRAGPVSIEVPDFGTRYYSVALMDEYTNNFAYIGSRSTGTKPGLFWVVAPGWKGELPKGSGVIQAPTPNVTLLVRILVDGAEDLPAVHALQDGIRLTAPAPAPVAQAVIVPVANDGVNFVEVVNQALGANPPPAADSAELARLARVGVCPGGTPLTPELAALWKTSFAKAQARLRTDLSLGHSRKLVSGWSYSAPGIGNFGTDYELRAAVALGGLLALTREEAVYGVAATDSEGRPIDPARAYRLHVPAALPLDGFWSLSIYEVEDDGRLFFADNPLHRYAIGDRTRGLQRNTDGSLDLLIQREAPPEGQRANWLPTPQAARIRLALRLYLPKQDLLEGRFSFPALERLN